MTMVKQRGAPREMTYEAYKAREVGSLIDGDTVLLLRQQESGRKDIVRLPAEAISIAGAVLDDISDVEVEDVQEGEFLKRENGAWRPGTAASTVALDDLSDVSVSGATEGQVLTRTASGWEPQTPGSPVSTLDSLTDVDTSGAAEGDYLVRGAAGWEPQTPSVVSESGVSNGFFLGRTGGAAAWRSPASARSDLSLATPEIGGTLVGDSEIVLIQKAANAYTVTKLIHQDLGSASGTITLKINGAAVTGIDGVAFSSDEDESTATAANSIAAGDKLSLVCSSADARVGFSVHLTRG